MNRQVLTESMLREMIENAVNEALEDEGLWNQIKAGAKSAFGQGAGKEASSAKRQGFGGLNLGKRWNAAKTGYQQQGKVDQIDQIVNFLQPLVQSGKIDPNQTVAQLLHNTSAGERGKLQKGSLGQMRMQANSKASQAQNDIYR